MDAQRVDTVAKHVAARRTRRQVPAQSATGLVGGVLAAAGLAHTARAQGATPAAGETGEKVEYLFVQSFRSGTIAPKAGAAGTYTLTLEQGLGQTIAFSDRPERVVGAAPTAQFLKGLGFPPDNPPNAALIVEASPGTEDIAVVELSNPTYDEATHTATYAAKVLAEYEKVGITFQEEPTGAGEVPAQFGAAALFIDSCPDITVCYTLGVVPAGSVPGGPIGTCWNGWTLICEPCNGNSIDSIQQLCNQTYPDQCGGSCIVYTAYEVCA